MYQALFSGRARGPEYEATLSQESSFCPAQQTIDDHSDSVVRAFAWIFGLQNVPIFANRTINVSFSKFFAIYKIYKIY